MDKIMQSSYTNRWWKWGDSWWWYLEIWNYFA